MYKGIKIVITIFIAFSGLLNAMEERADGSRLPNHILVKNGNNLSAVETPKPSQLLSEESTLDENYKKSFSRENNAAAGVGSEDLGNLVKKLCTNKESEEDNSISPGLYIITRPFVWSSKLTNKFLKSLEERPIARTLFACSMQTAADIVALHPKTTASLLKSGISKSGNAVKSYIVPAGLVTFSFSMYMYQTGWFAAGVSALFGSGNLLATWRVGGKVAAIGKQVEEVIRRLDMLGREASQLNANINQLSEDDKARYIEIMKAFKAEKEKLESLKTELTALVDKRANQIESKVALEINGVLTRIGKVESNFGRRFDTVEKTQEDLLKGQGELKEGQKKSDAKQEEIGNDVKIIKEAHGKKLGELNTGLGEVKTIAQSLQEDVTTLNTKVDSLGEGQKRIETRQEEGRKKLDEIAEQEKQSSDLLKMMKTELESLGTKVAGMDIAQIVKNWQTKQGEELAKTQEIYEKFRIEACKIGEKWDALELKNASISGLQEFQKIINGRMASLEQEVKALKEKSEIVDKKVDVLDEKVDAINEKNEILTNKVTALELESKNNGKLIQELMTKNDQLMVQNNQLMAQNNQMMGMMQVLIDQNKSAPVSSGDSSVGRIMNRRGLGPKFKSGSD